MNQYDILVIGGGPASMGAVQYLDAGVKLGVISDKEIGYFVNTSVKTHNTIDGLFFAEGKKPSFLINFYKKLISHKKVKVIKDTITKIEKTEKGFKLSGKENYFARFVIVATGMNPKSHKNFFDYSNVFAFAGDFNKNELKGKTAVVIGGRNSGSTAAVYLSKYCKCVFLLEKQKMLPSKTKYQARINKRRNIKVITGVSDIECLESIQNKITKLKVTGGKVLEIMPDLVFQYVGLSPKADLVNGLCVVDEKGYIIVDKNGETSCKGLFAAGDVTGRLSQIVVAHGDGANAIYWIQKRL